MASNLPKMSALLRSYHLDRKEFVEVLMDNPGTAIAVLKNAAAAGAQLQEKALRKSES
jgi:hypothetical protein